MECTEYELDETIKCNIIRDANSHQFLLALFHVSRVIALSR